MVNCLQGERVKEEKFTIKQKRPRFRDLFNLNIIEVTEVLLVVVDWLALPLCLSIIE